MPGPYFNANVVFQRAELRVIESDKLGPPELQ